MKKLIFCNKNLDKKKIKNLIEWYLKIYGSNKTSKLLEEIKKISFHYSTTAGISLGKEDLVIPESRKNIIKRNNNIIKKNKFHLKKGKINQQ